MFEKRKDPRRVVQGFDSASFIRAETFEDAPLTALLAAPLAAPLSKGSWAKA